MAYLQYPYKLQAIQAWPARCATIAAAGEAGSDKVAVFSWSVTGRKRVQRLPCQATFC